jgi:hypothetical protein
MLLGTCVFVSLTTRSERRDRPQQSKPLAAQELNRVVGDLHLTTCVVTADLAVQDDTPIPGLEPLLAP